MIDENANRDVADVINYIKATEFAIARCLSIISLKLFTLSLTAEEASSLFSHEFLTVFR